MNAPSPRIKRPVVACFTPGTMIATLKGETAVEDLVAGDKIITRDNGIQVIRWVGQKKVDWRAMSANPHLKPVLVRQGSLGHNLPERDLLISQNHRILAANARTAVQFNETEVLVAAKHLIDGASIRAIDSIGTTYFHVLFDRHEVVLSNGIWTESFHPTDHTLKGFGNSQRAEIFEIFPVLDTAKGRAAFAPARKTLTRKQASSLVE